MANQLINRGTPEQQGAASRHNQETDMRKKPELKAGETNERPTPRCMLYQGTSSRIFKGESAIRAARKDGWEDEPPAKETAQAAGAAAFDQAAADRMAELEELAEKAEDAADDATERAEKAEASAKAESARADSAEKKLAAAEKKLAANARK